MTNVRSDVLLPTSMGKCLKTDSQIAKDKIYQNNNSTIKCNTKPEKSLINEINEAIKSNIKSSPILPKENISTKIKQKVTEQLNVFKRLMSKNKTPVLQEGITAKEEPNTYMEFTKCESFMDLEDRNSEVFQIQTWERGNVKNRLRTSYLEVSGLKKNEISELLNNEEFKEFYKALLDENKANELYIGRIDLVKDDNGEMSFVGYSLEAEECIGMTEIIQAEARKRSKEKSELNNIQLIGKKKDEEEK